MSKLSLFDLTIIGKYFNDINDFKNLSCTCKEYNGILSQYHFNPIPIDNENEIKLFDNMETIHIYDEYHEIITKILKKNYLHKMNKQIYWIPMSYGFYKTRCPHAEFKLWDDVDIKQLLKYKDNNDIQKIYSFREYKGNTNVNDNDNIEFSVLLNKTNNLQNNSTIDFSSLYNLSIISKYLSNNDNSIQLIKHIILPNSITIINKYTFSNFINLETINLEDCKYIEKIKNNAFYNCNNLKEVIFNNENTNLDKIEFCCFENCTNLSKVILPKSIKIIDYKAFNNCSNLIDINLDELDNLEEIGNTAFKYVNIEHLNLSSNVRYITYNCFNNCNNLKSIDLSKCLCLNSITGFADCMSLSKVILPTTITQLYDSAFKNCSNLIDINLNELNNLEEINEYSLDNIKLNIDDIDKTGKIKEMIKKAEEKMKKILENDEYIDNDSWDDY